MILTFLKEADLAYINKLKSWRIVVIKGLQNTIKTVKYQ